MNVEPSTNGDPSTLGFSLLPPKEQMLHKPWIPYPGSDLYERGHPIWVKQDKLGGYRTGFIHMWQHVGKAWCWTMVYAVPRSVVHDGYSVHVVTSTGTFSTVVAEWVASRLTS